MLSQRKLIASAFYDGQPQLSPDQTKIVFASLRSGENEVWRSDADGSNILQLTSFGGELAGTPRWSPDGKWIAFDRRPGKHSQIYVIDAEGRNLHAITSGEYENSVPSYSRDGQWIYFGSKRTGEWQLWKQKPGGGGPVQVTRHGGFTAFESYDRKTVYYSKRDGEGIWSIPVGGGAETRVTAAPRLGYWGSWAVSETGLYVLDDDIMPRPTIEFYNFKTRKLTPVIPLEHSGHAWDPGPRCFARRPHGALCCSGSRSAPSPWWRTSNDIRTFREKSHDHKNEWLTRPPSCMRSTATKIVA